MPQDYNIPIWFSEEYKRRMPSILLGLSIAFRDDPHIVIRHMNMIWPSSGRDWPLEDALIWSGPGRNIGVNILIEGDATILPHLLGGALSRSIEVLPGKPAASEGGLPYYVTSALDPSHVGPKRVEAIRRNLSEQQLEILAEVLELVAMRFDEAGDHARSALAYWAREVDGIG